MSASDNTQGGVSSFDDFADDFLVRAAMKVLWPHNFDPGRAGSGSFMHLFAEAFRCTGVRIDLFYLGNLRSPARMCSAAHELRKLSLQYDLVHSQFGSACGLVSSNAQCPKILSLLG